MSFNSIQVKYKNDFKFVFEKKEKHYNGKGIE